MTFIYELGLAILNLYLRSKNQISRSRCSKVRARTDRHTVARDRKHYYAAFADESKQKMIYIFIAITKAR